MSPSSSHVHQGERIGSHGPAARSAVRIRERIAAKRARAALQPGWMLCPRCEGQRYDQGSCPICENSGRVREALDA
jgi:uncharacterized paraquat-inducible protein A